MDFAMMAPSHTNDLDDFLQKEHLAKEKENAA